MKRILVLVIMLAMLLPFASAEINDLKTRGAGPCKYLRGNVRIITVFVNTPRSRWTQKEIDKFYKGFWKNTAEIEVQAARYGTELKLSAAWTVLDTKYNVSDYGDKDFNIDWYWDLCSSNGFTGMQQWHDAWLDGCDDAAILFIFDEEGRCYSYESRTDDQWQEEFPVYFARSFPDGKIDHEFYHLFGAIDMYAPDEVYKAAKRYLHESIMMGGTIKVDSYNAVLLGWTNHLDSAATSFRRAIANVK